MVLKNLSNILLFGTELPLRGPFRLKRSRCLALYFIAPS